MTEVKVFKNRILYQVKWNVEEFLNNPEFHAQILDISWFHADSYWHCIITYFTVE